MPQKRKKECIRCQFFTWLLGIRQGVFFGDGRSNKPGVGRHSLGTRDRQEALKRLNRLDLVKAVELGQANPSILKKVNGNLLSLEEGQSKYLAFASRPPVQGGVAPSSVKRYRTVLDKFVAFSHQHSVAYWQQVTKGILMRYGQWMDELDYAFATQYLELTTVKQTVKWMVEEGLLLPEHLICLKLKKPQGTTRYCYSHEEVQAIVDFCQSRPALRWLTGIVVALAATGLRIGELADIRWSDVDLNVPELRLIDTSTQGRKSNRDKARTTKSHQDRTLPIRRDLLQVLQTTCHRADGRIFSGPPKGRIKSDTVLKVLRRDVLSQLAKDFPARGDEPGILAGCSHSFRHYFCSISANTNVPEQMLMSWLGHKESKMIKHYYHLQPEEARKRMGQLPLLSLSTEKPRPGD